MAFVAIEEYNRREVEAIKAHSNRLVESFAPAHFSAFGYPSRVQDETELFKFVDVMQERRFEYYFDSILKALTPEEHALFHSLASGVAELCKKRFGRNGCGKSALAHSLNVLRHIRFLTDNRPVRVFEIGPGCGYLGAMLTASGYPYMSYDVTQAFYLYQNLMWSHLYGSRVVDLAQGGISGDQLSQLLSKTGHESHAIHLPWWEYMKIPQGKIPTVDVITCNHVLCEMHNASHSFASKLSRLMLEGSSGPRLVILEGWGWHASNRLNGVLAEMYRHGFVLAHQDQAISILALQKDLPPGLYQDFGQAVETRGALWHAGKCYVDESVRNYENPNSPIAQKLQQARQQLLSKQTISRATVREGLVGLVGEEGLTTDDERFLDFIERPRE